MDTASIPQIVQTKQTKTRTHCFFVLCSAVNKASYEKQLFWLMRTNHGSDQRLGSRINGMKEYARERRISHTSTRQDAKQQTIVERRTLHQRSQVGIHCGTSGVLTGPFPAASGAVCCAHCLSMKTILQAKCFRERPPHCEPSVRISSCVNGEDNCC